VATVARKALDLVKKNIKEYNIECEHSEQPGYLYSQDKNQTKELDEIYHASQKAGCEIHYEDKIPLPIDFIKAIVYERQAQFHPAKYFYALAKAFEDADGVLLQGCRITGVHEKGDHLEMESHRGKIQARQLIYATHIPPGVNLLHFRCAPYRSYVMAVKLKDDNYPDALAYDMYDPYHYYRTQEVDGKKYLIAGGEDHKTAHEGNTNECFRKLEAYLMKYFKVEEVSFKWSSQYFQSTDGLPYIGHLPGTPDNIFVATGFGGNGMTYSHVTALLLTDLIANGKIHELVELAPGEAKVVKYEGDTIALYKDENGGLHAVNPACTHINCIVGWNTAEQTWDCPCHGSRFSMDGKVLTAPARKDLEKISLTDLTP